jgi:ectoine hydroxylase-related dioxygenase (phytanoyl-CoA dioxygenase family)
MVDTRSERSIDDPIEFDRFHRDVLPRRLAAGNGALAADDARKIGSLAIRTPAGAFTYVPSDGTIEIIEGDDDAKTVIALDDESWRGLASDLDTPPGLLYGGRVETVRGNPLRFVRWEPALRAMYHGRPVYDAARVDLHGIDPSATFTMAEVAADPGAMRAFLDTCGYVLVRNVFTAHEIAGFLEDADVLRDEAREGDKMSWWGRDVHGETVLCRVLRAASRPRLRSLHTDPRVLALADLAPIPVTAKRKNDNDGVTVLWKRPDVTEGLADLPWHRDCGMGGHALNCPGFVMTICLTDGSAAAGELRALPGSHHMTHPTVDGTEENAPRGVSFAASAGDVSFHYSDVLHASMPPTSSDGPHRISVLLGFSPEGAGHHRGERHYNDVLLSRDDGLVPHLVDHVGKRRESN